VIYKKNLSRLACGGHINFTFHLALQSDFL